MNICRRRRKSLLIAGCVTPSQSPACVTLRVCSSACSDSSKFRSNRRSLPMRQASVSRSVAVASRARRRVRADLVVVLARVQGHSLVDPASHRSAQPVFRAVYAGPLAAPGLVRRAGPYAVRYTSGRARGSLDRASSRAPGPTLGGVPGVPSRSPTAPARFSSVIRPCGSRIGATYQALFVQGRGALGGELTVCLRPGRALLHVPRMKDHGSCGDR